MYKTLVFTPYFNISESIFLSPEDDAHVGELPWLGLVLSLGEALVCPREGQIPRGIPPALAVVLVVHRPSVNIPTLLDSEVWLLAADVISARVRAFLVREVQGS